MSNNYDGSPESIDRAMDTLIIATARFNEVLAKRGIKPITQPTRTTPIEPFFHDLTLVIEFLVPLVEEQSP